MDLFFKKFAGVRKKSERKFGRNDFFSIFAPLFTKDSSLKRLKSN
jgi:hypothetical protein